MTAQYSEGISSKIAYYRHTQQADKRSFQTILATIERHTPPGRILDVGCNIGTFVATAKERGWDAVGVDINSDAVMHGRQSGLNLLTLSEFEQYSPIGFDVVHSSDTIEHLLSPLDAIGPFASTSRAGGFLCVSTPNYDSLACRLLQLKPAEHVCIFDRHSLSFLFERVGFEILDTCYIDRYRNLSAMSESTTFDRIPIVQKGFRLLFEVWPEITLRLPLRENILILGRRL